MSPKNLKYNLLDKIAQVITFDQTGIIKGSCHSMVDLTDLVGASLFDAFVFAASIREQLDFSNTSQVLSYHAVEFDFKGKKGLFDFHFYQHPGEPGQQVWMLIDHTQHYLFLQTIQQERNELLIEIEKMRKNGNG